MASEQQKRMMKASTISSWGAGRVPEADPRSNRSAAGCGSKLGQTALAAA
jgi:hypothetical protein